MVSTGRKGCNIKVLIAGATGLVGRAIVQTSPEGHDLLTPNRHELNLEDFAAVASYMEKEKPDAIILAAAKVGGIAANSSNQYEFLIRNLNIQNALIDAAVKNNVPNLLYLGSSCVYPRMASQPIKESSLLTSSLEETNEGYALAKISGIKLCHSVFLEKNLNYFSLMPTNLYGPHDNFDLQSSHVPAALMRRFHEAKVANLKSVQIWGSGNVYREFMHVDDLANACWFFLSKPSNNGDLINIGTGTDTTIKEFAETMARIVGYDGELVFDASKPEGTPRKLLDVSKASLLGWKSKIGMVDGLKMTYKWFEEAYSKGEVRGL
jgi:GDP-L-fucose synthase